MQLVHSLTSSPAHNFIRHFKISTCHQHQNLFLMHNVRDTLFVLSTRQFRRNTPPPSSFFNQDNQARTSTAAWSTPRFQNAAMISINTTQLSPMSGGIQARDELCSSISSLSRPLSTLQQPSTISDIHKMFYGCGPTPFVLIKGIFWSATIRLG
jgi:hypothetical protein